MWAVCYGSVLLVNMWMLSDVGDVLCTCRYVVLP